MTHLVLLSGWGVAARIWRPLDRHWSTDITITAPDWPGYGGRAPLHEPDRLDALTAAMSGELPEDAVWVGWSLGGLLAAKLLEHLPAPRALILLGMNARFTVDATASAGVTANELSTFQRAFERAPEKTWRHFLRWQLAGEPDSRSARQRLEDLLGLDDLPADKATLASGLKQLATLDISHSLASAACPIMRIRGSDDPLLPPADGREHAVIANAGHCPQLSASAELARRLSDLACYPAQYNDTPREAQNGC
ncbi:pimeloyl-[acyl-carrier protein] methyl ester esterase [Modicisalibacter muralis]|uniref:Pimeloyl-[acyl-carrier protein] methyl ester esterase n=1 Tax=Modicisalibacter muralis TaxID=119000 RepID=A0A1G9MSD0_9GAMM|nr:alpha/beta fold hydrolase [Halomonas muralis]SDL77129.1 pimeloyl-[acyl-carrier protein] methyl ester esterase [Halomonas muralis]